ncbi:KH domain-containing protein [Candidatus Parcubacteria bacterium]|jgi:predicted RNA-binding protein YlqC (UPF0109 family)|nr:KH domain-containing protein [Candidatus Parcubacteria bacterium]
MAKDTDKDFLEFVVKALVDHPDDVKVDRKVDEMGVLLSLRIHSEDMGQIIGKEGSTARSIRNLVRIIGLKNHARVNLKIEEPEGGRGPARPTRGPEEKPSAEGAKTDLEDLKL